MSLPPNVHFDSAEDERDGSPMLGEPQPQQDTGTPTNQDQELQPVKQPASTQGQAPPRSEGEGTSHNNNNNNNNNNANVTTIPPLTKANDGPPDAHSNTKGSGESSQASSSSGSKGDEPARVICMNDSAANEKAKFCSNYISTGRYTLFTFIPKNLFEQFSRVANLYFLLISCLQMFTDLSPTGRFTTAGPLLVVLLITATKEAYEDYVCITFSLDSD
eukprot:TRINITY_DN2587_c0_g1_i1.p1 TRINITY_DN2587_c0_g1~~TRINITY_DN2587_c0_g1_i1.p1  ORF type:complete len:218 (+),score=33.42 TRINITY_DN2587_c0_g1_i1:461-1114(+)